MLHVHRAEGTARLAEALAELLRVPLPDVFAQEVVAVPARGVERWLSQRLAGVLGAGAPGAGDGICSGVAFPSPGRLVDEALAAGSGSDPRTDPWASPVWPLLAVVDESLGEPWCAVLAQHLGHGEPAGHRRGRRWAVAASLAELYRSYGLHRPQLLRDWAVGSDTDGDGPLPDDLRWQAELWRRLRARLGPSPAERLEQACAALVDEPARSALPERLSLFGPTRLPTAHLQVLEALARHREVHLWLAHPSPALWRALEGRTATRRRADTTATLARHPLLRSMTREVRELQLRLPAAVDVHHGGAPRPATLLGRLQDDLRDDRPPAAGAAADGTLVVHACHGPARQVEVLREVLLRLFQDDPTLEPRDVLVLCPDVETFAPLVQAAFGGAGADDGAGAQVPAHPGHRLRVRLADRSLRRTNPLLDTVATLLELAGSRVTASQVLDLAATPGVRRRFGFDDEQLERVRDWVARSGVRWGLDAAGRRPYGLAGVPHNTWRTGLDRLLLGVTTAEDEPVWLGLALPLDDVDSSDTALAGRLAELLDRLEDVLGRLTGERPAQEWVAALLHGLDLLTATAVDDAWQLEQARRELAEAAEGAESEVGLSDVRAALAGRLRGRPTRANFRTGTLTVCTMVPMRSVPHRVVALLGLDDGVFPRAGGVDGDDVLARDPCVGERDVRAEDRQLLLDAVLSAGDRLVVLHTGADPVSGAARPPAVPVGELLDVAEAMTGSRADLVVRHPLQPHDARQFTGGRPFSFDPVNLAGARRAGRPADAEPVRSALPERLGPVALDDLVRFVEHPVRAYAQQRLRLTLPGEDDEVEDALAVALDGLQEWAVGERMLAAALRGTEPADARRAEWLRGTLPPGPLGAAVLTRVEQRVGPLVEASAPLLAPPARAVDVRVDLGGGRLLTGTVDGVRGDAVVTVSCSTLAPKHRLRAWVLALALAAGGEGERAVTVGRRGMRAVTSTVTAPPHARALLAALVDLHDRGLREPLPLASATSAAYAAARVGHDSVEQALESARREWEGGRFPGEDEDRHHRWAFGGVAPLERLTAAAARPAEHEPDEPTRFGALAVRLWTPLLAVEDRA